MTNSSKVAALKAVLRAGASVFGLSAILLITLPRFFTDLLGLVGSAELDWAMRMIGLTLVALSGNMWVVSRSSSDRGVLLAARVMQFAALGLGVVTLLIPTGANWFVIAYALVGFGFSLAYTLVLIQKD